VYRNYSRWLCDVVIRLAVPPHSGDLEETQVAAVRRLISLGIRDGLNGRNSVALKAPERESSTGRSYEHLPPGRYAEPSRRGGPSRWRSPNWVSRSGCSEDLGIPELGERYETVGGALKGSCRHYWQRRRPPHTRTWT
jgi:hypothetical protein